MATTYYRNTAIPTELIELTVRSVKAKDRKDVTGEDYWMSELRRHPSFEWVDHRELVRLARQLVDSETVENGRVRNPLEERRKALNETNGFMLAPLAALPDLMIAKLGSAWFHNTELAPDIMEAVRRLEAVDGVEKTPDGWYRVIPNKE